MLLQTLVGESEGGVAVLGMERAFSGLAVLESCKLNSPRLEGHEGHRAVLNAITLPSGNCFWCVFPLFLRKWGQ